MEAQRKGGTEPEIKSEGQTLKGFGDRNAREKKRGQRGRMILALSHRNQQGRDEVKETTEGQSHVQAALEKEERDRKMVFNICIEG